MKTKLVVFAAAVLAGLSLLSGCDTASNAVLRVTGPTVYGGSVVELTSGGTVDFGSDLSEDLLTITITIENVGAKDLTLSEAGPDYITIAGDLGAFSIESQPATDTIPPGGTVDFIVGYQGSFCDGFSTASITISSDDSGGGDFTLQFGAAVACP